MPRIETYSLTSPCLDLFFTNIFTEQIATKPLPIHEPILRCLGLIVFDAAVAVVGFQGFHWEDVRFRFEGFPFAEFEDIRTRASQEDGPLQTSSVME